MWSFQTALVPGRSTRKCSWKGSTSLHKCVHCRRCRWVPTCLFIGQFRWSILSTWHFEMSWRETKHLPCKWGGCETTLPQWICLWWLFVWICRWLGWAFLQGNSAHKRPVACTRSNLEKIGKWVTAKEISRSQISLACLHVRSRASCRASTGWDTMAPSWKLIMVKIKTRAFEGYRHQVAPCSTAGAAVVAFARFPTPIAKRMNQRLLEHLLVTGHIMPHLRCEIRSSRRFTVQRTFSVHSAMKDKVCSAMAIDGNSTATVFRKELAQVRQSGADLMCGKVKHGHGWSRAKVFYFFNEDGQSSGRVFAVDQPWEN